MNDTGPREPVPYVVGQISGSREQISTLVEAAFEPNVQPGARFGFLVTLGFEVLLDIRELLILTNEQLGAARSHDGILLPRAKGLIVP